MVGVLAVDPWRYPIKCPVITIIHTTLGCDYPTKQLGIIAY